MWKVIALSVLISGCLCFISCAEYTPKPRGYFRIDPPLPTYSPLPLDDLPYSFHISSLVTIELPPVEAQQEWLNLVYPSLQAKIYCSYIPITPSGLDVAMEESRELVLRQAKQVQTIQEKAFDNTKENVYATLFLLDGESASPIQFTVTDSSANFFRGALYYNTTINADSLAPATQYIQADIIELIQSFTWKH